MSVMSEPALAEQDLICPACDGEGGSIEVIGVGDTQTGEARIRRCSLCQGEGEIAPAWAEYLEIYNEILLGGQPWSRRLP